MTNCGKLSERWEYQIILPASWEACMWVKKQQLEPCVEQLIGSRLRKEYGSIVCCHLVCLTYMLRHIKRNAGLGELQAEIKIDRRNINNLRYVDDTTLKAESQEEIKSFLMRVKEEEWKSQFKTKYLKI